MPVLSCNHVTYSSGTASYSCVLQNQCALVKFTTASTTDPVHVGGLYTEAMIDFDNNSITNNGTTGFVNLHPDAEDNEAKWAVLLPQTSFSGIEGVVADKGYTMQTQTTILADGFITGDDFSISSTPSHNRYLQWAIGDLTLEDGDQVYGTLGGQYRVSIAAGATTNGVTLNGVTIDRSGLNYPGIKCLGNATITLKDGTANTVKGFNQGYPGIYVPEGSTLIIQGETTPGTGSLDAFGRGTGGAGIGGGKNSSCGNITISGGIVSATGGQYAAGIGGGRPTSSSYTANCGNIFISGGIVTAEGGERAAGIGGGKGIDGQHKTKCGTITITSGVTSVEATRVSSASAYIGAGWSCTCGKVTIDDVENATTSSTFEYFNSTINGNTWTLMHK